MSYEAEDFNSLIDTMNDALEDKARHDFEILLEDTYAQEFDAAFRQPLAETLKVAIQNIQHGRKYFQDEVKAMERPLNESEQVFYDMCLEASAKFLAMLISAQASTQQKKDVLPN